MTKTHTGPERRKYPRVEEEMTLLYKPPKTSAIKSSSIKNIGGGGACFETERHISPKDVLEIQINKPISRLKATLPINVQGKVVWIKQDERGKYRLGLQFIDIDDKSREQIIKNVEKSLKNKLD